MADKSYTPIGSFTLSEIKSLCSVDPVFNKLSDSQQNSVINQSIQELGAKLNKLSKDTYRFDSTGDADLVLAPTSSSLSGNFTNYIQIDVASDGTITPNTTTSINFVATGTKSGTDPITYVFTLTGASVKSNTLVDVSIGAVDWSKDTAAGTVTVKANSGHGAFSVIVKEYKET